MVIEFDGKPHLKRVFRVGALVPLGEHRLVVERTGFAGSEKTPPDVNGEGLFPLHDNALDVLSREEKLQDKIAMVHLVNRSLNDVGYIERVWDQYGLGLVLPEGDPGLGLGF